MGRRRKGTIGKTCVDCKKVPEGEFCTERCLDIPIHPICGCNGTGKLPGSPPWLNIRCTCDIGRKNLTDRLGNKISKN